jgi:hypothetical protein
MALQAQPGGMLDEIVGSAEEIDKIVRWVRWKNARTAALHPRGN